MMKQLDTKDAMLLLESNYIGQLAYIYRNRPFTVPITYFYSKKDHVIIGYSSEGHKIEALRVNSAVALGVSEIESVDDWNSVVAHGTFKELSGSVAKAYLHEFSLGVKHLIIKKQHKALDYINQFSCKTEKDGDMPVVFLIKIDDLTGKMRRD
ncbi:pyridoxamine 5'-phosphate oxidase family protein [Mariniflexile ostreae]|uniref:Pyridoxamine 5'-phosphate oxidase family protein n=1 Tax=Mariniflexile ostreae TaxID=1520892 RepID=A0ABV5F9F8_9FLAO